ncbi:uncharacterized mitochondrial protein-like protein [Tanacetum coccineum]|uniref:Uncharacterized mitochondrial protein-like protein n=1 Tax=Tanacetum coccineum TaxID=301880 RepID=A0ABQ5AB47_9ASTR
MDIDLPFSKDPKSFQDDESKPSSDNGKKVDKDPIKESECSDQEKEDNINSINNVNTVSSTVKAASTNELNVHKGDILLVQVYVDDIIFGSTKKELCNAFEKLMHEKFQMSSMGELTFFLGLQTSKHTNGNSKKPLLKDEDGEEVDVHIYRSMIGSLMYLTSSRPDIMFAVCACAKTQYNSESVSHLYAVKRILNDLKRYITFCMISKAKVVKIVDRRKRYYEAVHKDLVIIMVSDSESTTVSASKQTVSATITTVDDIILAQALEEMKSTKPMMKGVVIQELGESTTTISSQLSSQQSQDKGEELEDLYNVCIYIVTVEKKYRPATLTLLNDVGKQKL